MIFTFAACQSQQQDTDESSHAPVSEEESKSQGGNSSQPTETIKNESQGNILIAYFSQTGNTETIAEMIAKYTGGDLFHIETVTVYPEAYNDLIEVAKQEQDNDERPALASVVGNMDEYQTVFIGFPNWWGTMPMAVFTFLESYEFAGKTVIPFCTHEGSVLGRSEGDIAKLIPEAVLSEGLAVRGSKVNDAEDDVTSWLEKLGFQKS